MEKNIIDPEFAAMAAPEENKATEIYPGMTTEEIKALFFDSQALKEPSYKVFQLNSDGHRYYYRFGPDGVPEFFPSVTTMLKQVMPTSPFLIDWMIANGKEGSAEKRDLAAAYGTFMHAQFETLIINRRYNFDVVPVVLADYIQRENLPDKVFNTWAIKIRKDVLAFAQFVRDYNVRPLAVEIGLVHPDKRFAGCIDLPCIMTDRKTKKDFSAIVDFKSGRNGFYEEHELQLHLYRDMWDVNFPGYPIERLFNFSPKDWRGATPTYNLKDQTNSKNAEKIPYLLALAAIEDEGRENTVTVVRGELNLDGGDFSKNMQILSLAELIKNKAEEREEPNNPAEAPENAEIFALTQETDKDTKPSATAKKTAKSKEITDGELPLEG